MALLRLRETLETFACSHTDAWLALTITAVASDLPARKQRMLVTLSGRDADRTIDTLLGRVSRREPSDGIVEELLLEALDRYLDREHARESDDAAGSTPPSNDAELAAWAEACGIGARLRDPVKVLGTEYEWLARRAGARTVGDAVVATNGGGRLRIRVHAHLAACAARVVAEQSAATRRAALLERPVDAELAALDARLVEAREGRRVTPRPAGTFGAGSVTFEPDPPRFRYFERDARDREVVLATILLEGERLELVTERVPRAAQPAVAVAALDAARTLLRDTRAKSHAAVRTWARTPSWSRALAALDEAASTEVAVRPLSFLIKFQRNGTKIWAGDVASGRGGAAVFQQESSHYLVHSGSLGVDDARVLRAVRGDLYAPPRLDEGLSSLVGHPRVYWNDALTRVRVESAALRFRARLVGEQLVLEAVVGDHALDAEALRDAWVDERCLLHRAGNLAVLSSIDTRQARIVHALVRHGASFPAVAAAEVLPRLERLGDGVEIVGALAGRAVAADARPIARIDGSAWPLIGVQLRVRPLAGGPYCVPGEGAAHVRGVQGEERVYTERDLASERARATDLLVSLGLDALDTELRDLGRALEVLGKLRERDDVAIEWLTGEIRRFAVERENIRVKITSQRDWFAIGGAVEVDGEQLALATLLHAARAGERFVQLSPGKLAELTDELRLKLAAVADHTHAARDGSLHIATTAAPAIAALADAPVAPPAFVRVLERLRAASETEPNTPAHLATTLRTYQREGFSWLARLASWGAGGVLADDMGLGKTLQAIALLASRAHEGPALVIAPTSVTGNWFAELARFGAGLRAIDHRESRAAVRKLRAGDVLVASYDLVTRDLESFEGVRFATLIVDEAQAVKNAGTQRAKAIRALERDVCFALTGTPIENHLGELWSIFSIACPGLLGSWDQFRERFAQPIEVSGDARARTALVQLLRPYLLRRTKEAVAPELPALTEITRVVELGSRERAGYEAMRRAAIEQLAGRADEPSSRFAALAALMRLRRLACHPRLLDDKSTAPSSKMEAATELLTEVIEGGHRALVFSQFTDHLALLKSELDARGVRYLYLDGATKAAERTRLCAAFQAHEAPLFLISLRAGGTGLNLTAADTVLHLDPWWNPAVEDQATDRAHRIGQTRAVTVVRLVARDTIEEAVVSLHGEKRALAEGLLEGSEVAGKLSVRELIDLMKGSSDSVVAAAADAPARGRRGGRSRAVAELSTGRQEP